jgi:hypothetical protein
MKTDAKRFVILFAPLAFAGCAALGIQDNSGTQLRQNLQTLNGQNWKAAVALLGRSPDSNECSAGDIPPQLQASFPNAVAMCQWSIQRGQGQRFVQTGTTTDSTLVGETQGNGWTAPIYQSNTQAVGQYQPVIYFCFIYIYSDKPYGAPDARIIGSAFEGSCGP